MMGAFERVAEIAGHVVSGSTGRNCGDKFSERAREALSLSEAEARRFNHQHIGTEHLLFGIVGVEGNVALDVLTNLGLDAEAVRSALNNILGRGEQPVEGQIGLTKRAKRAIELAVEEAKRFNHHYIGCEHLLLGLTAEGEGVAGRVLASLGVTLDRARAETLQILTRAAPAPLDRALKRYNLVLPAELFADVQQLADRQHTTVVELVRRFVRLGLLANRIGETPGAALIIREGEREREILML